MSDEARRILLVDDDEDEYLITRGHFEEMEGARWELDWERTWEGALARALRKEHAAYLFDYHLSATRTGLELLQELRAQGVTAPVLILTGQGDRETDLRAMQAGADDFLDKGQLTPLLLDRALRYAMERRRSDKLQQAEETLQEAVRLRDEFLSIASHELKTPLTPLGLQLERLNRSLAKQGLLTEQAADMVRVAQRQTRRLNDLVDNLLDVARITSGKLSLTRDPVDLAELAREVVERIRPQAELARCPITLRVHGAPLGAWDRLRVDQVITNLLSNALKYGAGKPVTVTVRGEGRMAALSVSDGGIGIAEEHAQRIFGRFERAASARHYGGLGLGLYITQQIVESHGGSISLESTPGEGATFTVLLPMRAAAEAAHEATHEAGATTH